MPSVRTVKRTSLATVIALIALISVACFFGGSDDGSSGGESQTNLTQIVMQSEPATISGVDLVVWPRGPMLTISSDLPSNCTRFHSSEIVSESGTEVAINVTNRVPAEGEPVECSTTFGTHNSMLELRGSFDYCQNYTTLVNGSPFQVQARHPTKTCAELGAPTPVPAKIEFPGQRHDVGLGGTVQLSDAVTLRFDRVIEDTRCAIDDTNCIEAGKAVIQLTTQHRTRDDSFTLQLDTGLGNERPVLQVNELVIRLIALDPHPSLANPRPQNQTATLVVAP